MYMPRIVLFMSYKVTDRSVKLNLFNCCKLLFQITSIITNYIIVKQLHNCKAIT